MTTQTEAKRAQNLRVDCLKREIRDWTDKEWEESRPRFRTRQEWLGSAPLQWFSDPTFRDADPDDDFTAIDLPDVWESRYLFLRHGMGKHRVEYAFVEDDPTVSLHRKYIRTNPNAFVTLLVVDVDHEFAVDTIWEAVLRGLPMPNGIVVNPETGHAHVYWFLSNGFSTIPRLGTETKRAITREMAERAKWVGGVIRAELGALIEGADPAYTNYSMRSPWFSGHVHIPLAKKPYHHRDLLRLLDVDLKAVAARQRAERHKSDKQHGAEFQGLSGRRHRLFQDGRERAYQMFADAGLDLDPDAYVADVETMLHEMNEREFDEPYDAENVSGLATYISTWVLENFVVAGGTCKRRDKSQPVPPDVSRRQASRGRESQRRRRETHTQEQIVDEMTAIARNRVGDPEGARTAQIVTMLEGGKMTQAAIAREVGVTRQRVGYVKKTRGL